MEESPGQHLRRDVYLAALRDSLQLLPLAEEVAGQGGLHLRVLFQPTFHDTAALTLHLWEAVGRVEMVVPSAALEQWAGQQSLRPDTATPPPPGGLTSAEAPVLAPAGQAFRAAVADLPLTALQARRWTDARDGMEADGEVVEDGYRGSFAAWSPTPARNPEAYRLCRALLDLGLACLPDARSQTVLTALHSYLHED
ncbi:MAG TPA: hypothetical protein VKY74_26050 [Chloroflexia bacterium]|nr:hypothetical protein [Chloroflexia bacterium]